ncbi:MAG: endonuclease III [Alphaproteobacteria bacterium]|nr:endonuclease III [Alphaproteobacteria bacterium]NDC55776.1 endonuclease III [Alphaproteobacteria bacterium]NDG04672.1 endonuclease III [Alphaproteobacteria bacterium]
MPVKKSVSQRINRIFEILSAANPAPRTELVYTNNFTLLVAVVLSAQMTDKGVNKATQDLFKVADTPEKMLALGEEKLKTYLRSINFVNTKTKNVLALCRGLMEKFNGAVPATHDELRQLPGVGRKTANVVLNCAFGHLTMPVDTHVFRVAHRLGFSNAKKPDDVERDMLKIIPQKWLTHGHHWLILHGRYVCTARAPRCATCTIAAYCNAKEKKHA